jgi:hypothetical protein
MRLLRRAAPNVAWALAFFFSYWPFTFTTNMGFIVWRFPYGEYGGDMTGRSLVQHVLAFVLIGAADRFGAGQEPRAAPDAGAGLKPCATPDARPRAIDAPLLARAFVFCCLLEIGQLFLPTRHAELMDLVVNASALLIGHVLASPL